jgi:hypothetical protein
MDEDVVPDRNGRDVPIDPFGGRVGPRHHLIVPVRFLLDVPAPARS